MAAEPVEEFEAIVLAADACIRGSQKRLRESRTRTKKLLKKPTSGKFPFNDDIDVLNAALEAIEAVTGTPSQLFDLRADPRTVFGHVRDAIIAYGDECRQEGRNLERSGSEPRVRPELALKLMTCLDKCNALLTASLSSKS